MKMTKTQAIIEARKRWGSAAEVMYSPKAPRKEEREKLIARLKAARMEREEVEKEINRRLAETPWWVELREKQRKLHQEIQHCQGYGNFYPCRVGKNESIFRSILGEGDTWEEAFAQVDQRRVEKSS